MKKRNRRNKSVGNGDGSLYWSDAMNCYVFQYYDNDKKRHTIKQRKYEKVRDFKKRVTAIKSDIDNGLLTEKNNETFLSILVKYVEQKHADGLVSDRSHTRDIETVNEIKKCCSNFINKPIGDITIDDIERSKARIREYSNHVINKIWCYIKKTFQIAVSRRKINYNIMLDPTLYKPVSKKVSKRVEALSIEEETKLKNILLNEESGHRFANIVLLQLYTGMRIGEVLALSLDCVDFDNNTLSIYRTLTQGENYSIILGEHTKTYKKRTGLDTGKRVFPMSDEVRDLIMKITYYYDCSNEYKLLFWNYNTNNFVSPVEINTFLRRINKKYNISPDSLHTHRLRHTFITRCVENGVYPKVIQNLVGHATGSSITNDIYTSVSLEFMVSELNKMK